MNNFKDSSILSHIVSRLSNRTEDIAVEALGYILNRSDSARKALGDILQSEELDFPELTDAETQVSDEKGARPDLVVRDRGHEKRILIEAKFWAGLTENQPNTYLAHLPSDQHDSVLLFVAPESRLETLWPELKRTTKSTWIPRESQDNAKVKSACVGNERRFLILTSWCYLLERMHSFSRRSGDPIEPDIRQLQVLCEEQDKNAFLPLKPHNLAPEVALRLLHFNALVDKAVVKAVADDFADTKKLNKAPQQTGYGRYLRLGSSVSKKFIAWFGINYKYWAKYGETPLYVDLYSKNDGYDVEITRAELDSAFGNDYLDRQLRSIPIHLPTGEEEEIVLKNIVSQLKKISEKIG